VPCTEDCDAENLDLCGVFVEDTLVIDSSDVTGNTVTGSCVGIGASHAVDLLVGDNDLTGPADASNCEYAAGIALSAESFESAVVSENTAAGFILGLDLYQAEAASFGARISRNDFGDNALPWWAFAENEDTHEPIPMHPIELSADGEGNYWGLTCDEGVNGFPPQSFCVGGDNHYFQCTGPEGCPGGECVAATSVNDSHPFGEPPGPSSVPCVP
jgi:nitrous oxidase accessory protein NosD